MQTRLEDYIAGPLPLRERVPRRAGAGEGTKDKRRKMTRLIKLIRSVWQYLREVSGEEDYPRYWARMIARGGVPLAPDAFYLGQLRQKYSRINRCC